MKKLIVIFSISLFVVLGILNLVYGLETQGGTDDRDLLKENSVNLDNPLGEDITPQSFIGTIIQGVLGIVGSLALAMFIYGGFIWMTAAGNAEQVTKGKNVLVWATLGLVIIFSSYALVRFVIYDLIDAPPETTDSST